MPEPEEQKPFDHVLASELTAAITKVLERNKAQLANRVDGVAYVVIFDETIDSSRMVKGGTIIPSEEARKDYRVVPRIMHALSDFTVKYVARHYYGLVEVSGQLFKQTQADQSSDEGQ